jgi:hypothetical protein
MKERKFVRRKNETMPCERKEKRIENQTKPIEIS